MNMQESYNDILDTLSELRKARSIIQDNIKDIITTEARPLWQRWNIYQDACNDFIYYNLNPWVLEFNFMKDLGWEWYDDFYYDRHRTVCLSDLYDQIFENLACGVDEARYEQEFVHEWLPKIQEEIMACGFTHFTYDW